MTESVQEVRDHSLEEKAAAREEQEELEQELVKEVEMELKREEVVKYKLFGPEGEEADEREGGARSEVSLCSSCGSPETIKTMSRKSKTQGSPGPAFHGK